MHKKNTIDFEIKKIQQKKKTNTMYWYSNDFLIIIKWQLIR